MKLQTKSSVINYNHWISLATVPALFLLLAVLLFKETWLGGRLDLIATGDPRLFVWYLRWIPWAIIHGKNPLLTHYLVYPNGANLMWNTSIIFPAVVLWPITAILGPIVSYYVLMTLAPVLSAWCAYLALRRHASSLGAFVGGLIYGFSPFLTAQALGHPMVTLALFPPIAMLLIENILTGNSQLRYRSAILLGLASTAQLLTGTEMLLDTAIAAIIGLFIIAIMRHEEVTNRFSPTIKAFGVAFFVFIFTAAIPLGFTFWGAQHVNEAIQPPDRFVQDLASFVAPNALTMIAPSSISNFAGHFTGGAVESGGYLGIPLILIIGILTLKCWKRPIVGWSILLLIILSILSLGPHLHIGGQIFSNIPLPWDLIGNLPVVRNALPGRLMIPAYLAAGLLLAVAVDKIHTWPTILKYSAGTAAIGTALIAIVPLPLPGPSFVTPDYFKSSAMLNIPEGSVALIAPFTDGATGMLWQAEANMRFRIPSGEVALPGGNFGPPPSPIVNWLGGIEYPQMQTFSMPTSTERTTVIADMQRLGISTVVVGPSPYLDRHLLFFTELLGKAPEKTQGVYVWYHADKLLTDQTASHSINNTNG